jgi:hypothetical protein
MPAQVQDWTCSACSTEWVERATGHNRTGDVFANRELVIQAIDYTSHISPAIGLHDSSGTQLRRVLREWGLETYHGWLTYEEAYAIYSHTLGLMSGGAWYHWVACRAVTPGYLWIANSAPGYRGVHNTLGREDFQRLGPFSRLWVV